MTLYDELEKGSVAIDVTPNSKKNVFLLGDPCIVYIKAPAEHNKANEAVETFLSKIAGANVKIVRGKTTRKKIIRLV